MIQALKVDWMQIGGLVSAVGTLGVAAFGVTESLGKACAFSIPRGRDGIFVWGLPYVGFRAVRHMVEPLRRALACAYGADYMLILSQQYRADRSAGRAPDTIRQGVRLGLPFLGVEAAAQVIGHVWQMEPRHALSLAAALQAEPAAAAASTPAAAGPGSPGAQDEMQALAGRFSTALDARVNAAFALAEERYEARAKLVAGVVAVGLAGVFNLGLDGPLPWSTTLLIGLVAVPLGPVAKDLSSSLQNALTAFKSIPLRRV